MADTLATVPTSPLHRILRKPRLPAVSIGPALGALVLAYAKAATLLYVSPFGLDAGPPPRRDIAVEDGRDPRW